MKHHKEYCCEHRQNYTYLLGILKLGLSEEDNPNIKVRDDIFELVTDNLESRKQGANRDRKKDPETHKVNQNPKTLAPSFGNPKTSPKPKKNGT